MTANSIRTLVVDDEALARRGICARLATAPDFEVVGECSGGRMAVDSIRSLAPDLVFLDVQMPEVDGFDVIDSVGADRMPLAIFLTAFDAHALRAFESRAVDYLLKPINGVRFAEALARVRQRMRERAAEVAIERVAVRDRGCVVLLDAREIASVTADGDYVHIVAAGDRYLVRETLTAMAARLPAARFLRIHRSSIINVDHVARLEPMPNREVVVVMRSGERLRSRRSYEVSLRRALERLL